MTHQRAMNSYALENDRQYNLTAQHGFQIVQLFWPTNRKDSRGWWISFTSLNLITSHDPCLQNVHWNKFLMRKTCVFH